MNFSRSTLSVAALFAALCISQTAQAGQTWQATLGAQNKDMGKQVIAFLPNEMWIHAGDSINWTSASGDIHTVTFLKAGQAYTNFNVGCPGFSTSGASFDGSTCVTAPALNPGQSFAVKFPSVGSYKVVCLVHPHMTGVIHVLATTSALPYNQAFYNDEALDQTKAILADADMSMGHHGHGDMDMDTMSAHVIPGKNSVTAGIGEVGNTAAGFQSLSVVRFLSGTIEVRVGDTVEWSNLDPAEPHTVTFGTEPANPVPPVNATKDPDGALHATLHHPGDTAHSGFLQAAPMDQPGVPQSAPGTTVFRVTFTGAVTYDYICALHDELGMVGKVIVKP
jgi:plastocyanin